MTAPRQRAHGKHRMRASVSIWPGRTNRVNCTERYGTNGAYLEMKANQLVELERASQQSELVSQCRRQSERMDAAEGSE